jgi:DNA-binding LytR/AlgR family response regulator
VDGPLVQQKENLVKPILLAIFALALAAQDKLTITLQRGTVTRTAVIEGTAASEAMRALDYINRAGEYFSDVDVVQKTIAIWLLEELRKVPGSPINTAIAAEAAARAAKEKAEGDFLTAAGGPKKISAVQPKPSRVQTVITASADGSYLLPPDSALVRNGLVMAPGIDYKVADGRAEPIYPWSREDIILLDGAPPR